MVSALDSGSGGPGSSPGRGQCVVFLGNTHFTLMVPLSLSLRWPSIPSRLRGGGGGGGGRNTPSRFMLRKPEYHHHHHILYLNTVKTSVTS